MLLAGASAYFSTTRGGTFTFHVNDLPSGTGLVYGSAFIYIMLLASASANFASARGGAFTFDVSALPSNAWSDFGSALIFYSSFICILYLWN